MIYSHIVAAARNRVIGTQNTLPWDIPEDMKFFRDKTMGHIMIMGRKTYDSFGGRPLPKRLHIVITRRPQKSSHDHVIYVANIEEAKAVAKRYVGEYPEEVFIIGGGEIYAQTISEVDRIYLTQIDREFEGDTLYPEIPQSQFHLIDRKDRTEPVPFSFLTYERIS